MISLIISILLIKVVARCLNLDQSAFLFTGIASKRIKRETKMRGNFLDGSNRVKSVNR